MAACPRCSNEFNPLQGAYAPDGTVVCAPCGAVLKQAVTAQEDKAKGSSFIGAVGSVLIALASFAVEHRFVFFLFPLVAIGAGVMTAFGAVKDPIIAQALGWKRWPTVVLGGLGVLLALLSLVAYFL